MAGLDERVKVIEIRRHGSNLFPRDHGSGHQTGLTVNMAADRSCSKLAVIATDPKDTLVARPRLPASLPIKAMLASEEFHAAAAVSSRTLPSL
jgi:hypothetical protein